MPCSWVQTRVGLWKILTAHEPQKLSLNRHKAERAEPSDLFSMGSQAFVILVKRKKSAERKLSGMSNFTLTEWLVTIHSDRVDQALLGAGDNVLRPISLVGNSLTPSRLRMDLRGMRIPS